MITVQRGTTKREALQSTAAVQRSTTAVQRSTAAVQRSSATVQRSTLLGRSEGLGPPHSSQRGKGATNGERGRPTTEKLHQIRLL